MVVMVLGELVQLGYTSLRLTCVLCAQASIKALHLYCDHDVFEGHPSSVKLEQSA